MSEDLQEAERELREAKKAWRKAKRLSRRLHAAVYLHGTFSGPCMLLSVVGVWVTLTGLAVGSVELQHLGWSAAVVAALPVLLSALLFLTLPRRM